VINFLRISVVISLFHIFLFAHCQIPCGIYSDSAKIMQIQEDLDTIEKAMEQIVKLSSKNDPQSLNQVIRWTSAKETHAQNIQVIVTEYFMTQRLRENSKDYLKKLKTLHLLLVSSMKCKQSVELENVKNSRASLETFVKLFFTKEDIKHLNQHLK
tara:strand:+ start:101 stop:568 length:468 start_codon:yes stop_codon:yes gene_type:complete